MSTVNDVHNTTSPSGAQHANIVNAGNSNTRAHHPTHPASSKADEMIRMMRAMALEHKREMWQKIFGSLDGLPEWLVEKGDVDGVDGGEAVGKKEA